MKNTKTIKSELIAVGSVSTKNGFQIKVDKEFALGLTSLEGFTHVQVLWYANQAPEWKNEMLVMQSPYKGSPKEMGVFATRSPFRPNGICVSNVEVISIDVENGIINLGWIDAEDGTPVVDLKPYHPSEDRIVSAKIPEWGKSWPSCFEESGNFNWEEVFLF